MHKFNKHLMMGMTALMLCASAVYLNASLGLTDDLADDELARGGGRAGGIGRPSAGAGRRDMGERVNPIQRTPAMNRAVGAAAGYRAGENSGISAGSAVPYYYPTDPYYAPGTTTTTITTPQ